MYTDIYSFVFKAETLFDIPITFFLVPFLPLPEKKNCLDFQVVMILIHIVSTLELKQIFSSSIGI